jgi:hypothetical protein
MSEPDKMNFELEQALKSLHPAPANVDPIAAAFTAGRRSTRRTLHAWQSATAAVLLLAAFPFLLPAHPPAPIVPPIPHSPQILVSNPNPSPQSLFRLQQVVEQHGIDALPPTTSAPITAIRADSL